MAFTWPKDLEFSPWDLDVIDRDCPSCGRMMHTCDHRQRRLYSGSRLHDTLSGVPKPAEDVLGRNLS